MQRRLALSKSHKIVEQLKEMAKLSVLSDRINEIQEENIVSYPFVFFDGVKCARVEYNLSKWNDGEESHVTYHLDVEEGANSKETLNARFLAIEKSTRTLFWADLKVCVILNGKLGYESKNVRKSTS